MAIDRRAQEELVGAEWAEWYSLSPVERFRESMKLWETYLAPGGSLEPEPDTQSPFFDPEECERCSWAAKRVCSTARPSLAETLTLLVLADPHNLDLLVDAMGALSAERIAVPNLDQMYLDRGRIF